MKDNTQITPVPLDHELDHMEGFSKDQRIYFNSGFTLLASTGEHDILMWICIYKLKGFGTIHEEEGRQLTTLTILPKGRRGQGIFDNNFVRTGWHANEALKSSDVQCTKEGDSVVYKVQDRTYTARPPLWEVKGTHAGVELDLTYRQICPQHWILGDGYEKKLELGAAMYDVLCTVDGEIRVDGKTYKIKDGFGVHEHGLLSEPNFNLYGLYEAPHQHTWVNFKFDDLRLWFFQWTKNNLEGGRLWVEDKDITYKPHEGKGSTSFTVLDRWVDPRSALCVPCKWQVKLDSEEGSLELTIEAQSRHYYNPPMYNGQLMWMWFLCVGNGTFRFPDGRTKEIKDALICTEWGHSSFAAKETLSGPVL